jgi:hypothetical protein
VLCKGFGQNENTFHHNLYKMRPDLKYVCDEWIRRGESLGLNRSIDNSSCLFNPGEFILVISQSKRHPAHEELQPVSVLRVFHTLCQDKKFVHSTDDIIRLRSLFAGLEEDFDFLYDRMALQYHVNYRRDTN